MRFRTRLMGSGLVLCALAGCGGGDMGAGMPQNVDMGQDHSPKVDMPGMSPKSAVVAGKKSTAEAKTAIPEAEAATAKGANK